MELADLARGYQPHAAGTVEAAAACGTASACGLGAWAAGGNASATSVACGYRKMGLRHVGHVCCVNVQTT